MKEKKKSYIRTEELRIKMSKARTGEKNPMFGKTPWNKGLHPTREMTKERRDVRETRNREKAKKKREEKMRKKHRSIKLLKRRLWDIFSKFIRLKYADKEGMDECYTCGIKKPWEEMQAGHGISGRGNSILFDEEVVRPQCKYCNIFLRGNYDIFHAKLIKEYGVNILDKKILQKNTVKKFTPEEFQEKYEYYKNKVKELLEVKDEQKK